MTFFHKLSGSTLFTSLNASSGYWQMPLDKASSRLKTFITPFGRLRFRRVPFGISRTRNTIYQREMQKILDATDISEIRTFMGMVNFMAHSVKEQSNIMEPLSKLLHKDNAWMWDVG